MCTGIVLSLRPLKSLNENIIQLAKTVHKNRLGIP